MSDLTTLKAVKAWLNIGSDTDDAVISALIGQVSAVIRAYINCQDVLKRTYTETFTGSGSTKRMLKNYPVVGMTSVNVGYQSVPAGDGLCSGFWLDSGDDAPPGRMQGVTLNNYCFERMRCQIVYDAGYCVQDEQHVAAAAVTVMAPYGNWARDDGVSFGPNGPALIKVTGTPGAGQYALNTKIPGGYMFSGADVGAAIAIDYSYVPAVLEQMCIETIAERYKYRERIGQASKNMSGEVVSFSLKDMQDYVKTGLAPYRRMVPM